MATRWEVTKAVRASDLPAPSRLVMFVLADAADVGTAEIPPKHTPSLRVLAKETGLDRRTVQRHLEALETAGWIKRDVPSLKAQGHGQRVRYRLHVPVGMVPPGATQDRPGDDTQPPPGGHETAPRGGTDVPPRGHETAPNQILTHQTTSRSKKAASKPQPGEETTEQRVNRLSKIYTDRVQLSNFVAVRGVVKKAVNADVSDDKIAHGLNRLADENRAVTTDSLRYAIYGVPPSQFRQNGSSHKPFSDERAKDYEASW